tara:strand:+ start:154 stop:489 length:336 start_codon:yes stop_codon:yes gene_type:complete
MLQGVASYGYTFGYTLPPPTAEHLSTYTLAEGTQVSSLRNRRMCEKELKQPPAEQCAQIGQGIFGRATARGAVGVGSFGAAWGGAGRDGGGGSSIYAHGGVYAHGGGELYR